MSAEEIAKRLEAVKAVLEDMVRDGQIDEAEVQKAAEIARLMKALASDVKAALVRELASEGRSLDDPDLAELMRQARSGERS